MRFFLWFILFNNIVCCSAQRSTNYQKLINKVNKDEKFTGMIVLVKKSKGYSWKGATGLSSIENKIAMKTNALFQIGSTTKLITAVSILKLIDDGKLSIDEKVINILDTMLVGPIPYIQEITISQLLNHTSGIYGTNNNLEYINTVIGTEAGKKREWEPEELIALAYKGKNEPFGKPGEGVFYGDVNYILLGLVVEKICGVPLKEYVKKNIFKKLGLRNTFYITDFADFEKTKPQNTVNEYMYLSKEIKDFIIPSPIFHRINDSLLNTSSAPEKIDAAGGILSSIDDLGTLGEAFFKKNFLSKHAMNLLYEFSTGIEKEKINKSKQGPLRVLNKNYGILFLSEGDGPGGGNTLLAYHPGSQTIIAAHVNIFGLWTEKESIIDNIIPELIK